MQKKQRTTRRPNPARLQIPRNAGKPWSAAEDERLCRLRDEGKSTAEIAAVHGRTVAGIEARLEAVSQRRPPAIS